MKCFYHSADLDGHCSGELIRLVYPDCEMIGINYGDDFPWDDIELDETVYMVDFGLQPWSDMERLAAQVDLVWIDHHKSAIENMEEAEIELKGIQRSGLGACALVWEWLTEHEHAIGGTMPEAVRLLAEYDVWNHTDPMTMPFQYGMRLYQHLPGDPIWNEVLGNHRAVGVEGAVVLRYQIQQSEIRVKTLSFDTQLDDLRCLAANQGLASSQLFDSIWDPERYDCMLAFHWRKGCWQISLYSDKPSVDVSTAAKQHGGGGHKGAAGFQCDELPFKLPVRDSA